MPGPLLAIINMTIGLQYNLGLSLIRQYAQSTNVKISPPKVLNWHAMDMDRRVSDLKEPTFRLKFLSQHSFDAWIPASCCSR